MFLYPAIGHPLLFFGRFYLFLLLLTVLFDKIQLKGIKGYPTSDAIPEDVQVHKSGLPASLHKGFSVSPVKNDPVKNDPVKKPRRSFRKRRGFLTDEIFLSGITPE